MIQQEAIAAAVTADNADAFREQLRRLAQIDRRLELHPLSIQERFELCEERSAILAPWLD